MTYINSNLKRFILEHESDDINSLALKASSYPNINMPLVLQQIAGRKIAKYKIPHWYNNLDILYPKQLSLEQCSSEHAALYKTSLVKKGIFADLTGGMGVDFSFMSKGMVQSVYVESQPELIELAKHNFTVLNISNVNIINTDATEYLKQTDLIFDTIYIDPARRNETGKKIVLVEDCTPNILEIDKLLDEKSHQTIIKLSPMLDITHAMQSINNVTQIHIVSINNECKELLLVKDKTGIETSVFCVNIHQNKLDRYSFTYQQEENSTIRYTETLSKYLYEPNSSIMKAGAFKTIASRYKLQKLHPNSHLYTSDDYISNFQGRTFEVKKIISPNKKELKQLSTLNKANIATRNYPFSVAEIRKQTKLKDGGNEYIFATTLFNDKKVLILAGKI